MKENNQNILLVSYFFPPFPGIGGRRWAKFVKYLSRKGYTIHIISAKNPFNVNSLWSSDVSKNDNIKINALEGKFPAVLAVEPKSILQKIKYKLSLAGIKSFAKGTPYDRSIFWNSDMLKKADALIREHNIKKVIVSCAPFRSAYAALALKKKHPQLHIATDFRDPWTWGEILGYKHLKKADLKFEKRMQDKVVQESNIITVPVQVMKDHLIREYPEYAGKIHLLPHAFDDDECRQKKQYSQHNFRLAFYGTLYLNIEHYIKALAEIMGAYPGKITLDIYSDSEKYSEIWNKNGAGQAVNYYSPIQGRALFEKLVDYDFVLFIHPLHGIHNLSTKFYEIINCRIPILYIAEEGDTANFIKETRLGIHVNEGNLKAALHKLISGEHEFAYNREFDVTEYSFEKVTNHLVKLFE